MSIDTPPRAATPRTPAVPGPKPEADPQEPTGKRGISKAALAGATPLTLAGVETVGVNYGTTGILIASGVTVGGYVLWRMRGVLAAAAGMGWLQSLRGRGRTPRPPARGGARGALGRLTGRSDIGRARIGGSGGGRRGALRRLGSKARGALGGRGTSNRANAAPGKAL